MNIERMIAVMKAYSNGDAVQYLCDGTWVDIDNPQWNWDQYEYRIKPMSNYRPYKNVAEFINHWDQITTPGSDYRDVQHSFGGVWLRYKLSKKHSCYQVVGISDTGVLVSDFDISYSSLLKEYTYLDGSPCGIPE